MLPMCTRALNFLSYQSLVCSSIFRIHNRLEQVPCTVFTAHELSKADRKVKHNVNIKHKYGEPQLWTVLKRSAGELGFMLRMEAMIQASVVDIQMHIKSHRRELGVGRG